MIDSLLHLGFILMLISLGVCAFIVFAFPAVMFLSMLWAALTDGCEDEGESE